MSIILTVEKDNEAADLLREQLRRGYVIHNVDSGDAALRFLGRVQVDLIVLDLDLAGETTGQKTLFAINAALGANHPPVIVISDTQTPDLAAEMARLGVAQFIGKPYGMQLLCHAVERLAHGRK